LLYPLLLHIGYDTMDNYVTPFLINTLILSLFHLFSLSTNMDMKKQINICLSMSMKCILIKIKFDIDINKNKLSKIIWKHKNIYIYIWLSLMHSNVKFKFKIDSFPPIYFWWKIFIPTYLSPTHLFTYLSSHIPTYLAFR
jgi:hypothetical protein